MTQINRRNQHTKRAPFENVMERVEVCPRSGCWLVTGDETHEYARMKVDGLEVLAHRWSYSHFIEEFDHDFDVLHRCDKPRCINPLHLFLGTQKDNSDDMIRKKRAWYQKKKKKKASSFPDIPSLAPWFGSNRMGASRISYIFQNKKCKLVNVGFAGGLSEVFQLVQWCSQINVNDKHRAIINLAKVASNPSTCGYLIDKLRVNLVHPEVLSDSQAWLRTCPEPLAVIDLNHAVHYFTSIWMGRNSLAGTDGECKDTLSVRWTPGGHTAVKWKSALKMLSYVRDTFQVCTYTSRDVFEFIGQCYDESDSGQYYDPPFPEEGGSYKHKFSEVHHRLLEMNLRRFKDAPIVLRYYDCDLARELYTVERKWKWLHLPGRNASNDARPEVLILRNV